MLSFPIPFVYFGHEGKKNLLTKCELDQVGWFIVARLSTSS
jgi:hypothetical protein